MLELPLQELDAMGWDDACEWFDQQKRRTRGAVVHRAMDYWRYQGEDALQLLMDACREHDETDEGWRVYAADRKTRNLPQDAAREEAKKARFDALKAAKREEGLARAAEKLARDQEVKRERLARLAAEKAARGIATPEKRERWSVEALNDHRLQVNGGADLSGLPESTRESRMVRIANDALRAREASTVQVDTGNIEYRLKEQRWRERSKR
jgi:hypothetical protein